MFSLRIGFIYMKHDVFPLFFDAWKWSGIALMPPVQLFAGYEILNSQPQRYLPPPVCGRNVRLIRVLTTLLVFGTWCRCVDWQPGCITSKLPCSSQKSVGLPPIGLIWNLRHEPKLTDTIAGLDPIDGSLSACQPIESWPLRYWLPMTMRNL